MRVFYSFSIPPSERVWSKKDTFLLLLLLFFYSFFALYNLGSLRMPQTYWIPAKSGEYVVLDLGREREVGRLAFFEGLGAGVYNVDLLGTGFEKVNQAILTSHSIYVWHFQEIEVQARYLRLNVIKPGAMLYEFGVFPPGGDTPLGLEIFSSQIFNNTAGSPDNIIDEQETIPLRPSFLVGMYFDEIYFARTAYEHLNRLEPYEWTHPPLGKILIGTGISIFGMNTFGWRIVGTLFGVLMISIMYLLGLKIFKQTRYAFIAAILITFDFMHFAQTRLATIDVYAVFFIILMYYFILEYLQRDFYTPNVKMLLTPLAFTGLFFALGAATKWTCIYAGLGLAFLFFLHLGSCYQEYRVAKSSSERGKMIRHFFPINIRKVLVWNLLFFILIPLLVYLLSYIPFMMVPGPGHGFREVLSYQKNMYLYHRDLVATHPFSSSWWEWPLLIKPIWYYQGQGLPEGKISSIISMGNPAVWWVGVLSMLGASFLWVKKKDPLLTFLLVGFTSQYLPWVAVSRLTFIYHFYSSVPFLILGIIYIIKFQAQKRKKIWLWVYVYLLVVVFLFFLFYPILSGMVIERSYAARFLRWFPSWFFYQ